MKVVRVQDIHRSQLRELEKQITYPLGTDSFEIDHGANYFSFFKRLGEVHAYGIIDNQELVAVGMGILRSISMGSNKKPIKAWYLCDLKVEPRYRGQHLPLKILRKAFFRCYVRCGRGYAISMNPPKKANRVVKLLGRFTWAPNSLATILNIYSCDAQEMLRFLPVLKRHRGHVSFVNLTGKKDLILKSSGRPFPLLHAQFESRNPTHEDNILGAPTAGFSHMFCCTENDPMAQELTTAGLSPIATASVIHHRMGKCDWKFILTSDI